MRTVTNIHTIDFHIFAGTAKATIIMLPRTFTDEVITSVEFKNNWSAVLVDGSTFSASSYIAQLVISKLSFLGIELCKISLCFFICKFDAVFFC